MDGRWCTLSNILVRSGLQDYEVSFASFSPLENDRAFYILDSKIVEQAGVASGRKISLVASESLKKLSTIDQITKAMQESGLVREDKIVAVGGGIIQDLAT